jgi:hypothetical protein
MLCHRLITFFHVFLICGSLVFWQGRFYGRLLWEGFMAGFDLTDFEWSVIAPLLPTKVRGVKRVDDRRVLNGIFWRRRTGAPWAGIFS